MIPISICWMRRDLRWHDHASLSAAFEEGLPVLPFFIFDKGILDELEDRADSRVHFIHHQLARMQSQVEAHGKGIWIEHEEVDKAWDRLLERLQTKGFQVKSVHVNRDYEPYATDRDRRVRERLESKGIRWNDHQDHVLFEPHEVLKADGTPYTVFTPFSKRWLASNPEARLAPYPSARHLPQLLGIQDAPFPSLDSMGFESVPTDRFPPVQLEPERLNAYAERRDLPALPGTTRLSVHLRFGTVSIREAMKAGFQHSQKWLMELIWREFYQSILHHFPHSVDRAFKPQYDAVEWEPAGPAFEAWKVGKTGYPLVDAGMRELLATGFMHNRVRMVVASFLCKHLLLDWKLGERWFAQKLLDFELASNVGGWQWAAGTGCDAAPYFRVFNPTSQQEKFDPNFEYIRKWVPEFGTPNYPGPIVEHRFARARAIDRYKRALNPDQAQATLF